MAKKKKIPKPTMRDPDIVSCVRVAEVYTRHGVFYELVNLETKDGKVLGATRLHHYFGSVADILDRANEIAAATQMPVVTIDEINLKN